MNDIVTPGSSASSRVSVTNASAVPIAARYRIEPTAPAVHEAPPQSSDTAETSSSSPPPPTPAQPLSTSASTPAPRRLVATLPIAAPSGANAQPSAAMTAYRESP